jgi:signal peptidase I
MTNDEGSAASTTRDEPRRGQAVLRFLRDVAIILVAAIIISWVIKTFLVRSFYIPSESMEDTLLVNDRIIVNLLEPDFFPISRGDVVVFRDPGGWLGRPSSEEPFSASTAVEWVLSLVGLAAPDSDEHLIKRVIGLPGDTVTCCDEYGRMSINGVPIDETAYVVLPGDTERVSSDDFAVTVPEGRLWVMGDNRYRSADSRYNVDQPGEGFVPMENVVGRAIVITWPVERWGWLDNYPTVFGGVGGVEPEGSEPVSPATTGTTG